MNKKIVLDTNCLVQMISMHSPYRPAWQAFREGKYLLCVSNDILNEYNEILEKVANAAVAHNIVNAIARSPYTRMFDPHFRFGLIEAADTFGTIADFYFHALFRGRGSVLPVGAGYAE